MSYKKWKMMPKIVARSRLVENLRSVVDNSRTHTVTCDLPPLKGGKDTGPSALELAIMALSGCAVTVFAKVAKESNIAVESIEVLTEAEKPVNSPMVEGVKMKVNIAAKARKQMIEAIWRKTEANCPVVKIFTESIPINIQFTAETIE
jgi:uncharacterized OsmC-like protein